jgi:hypothetical protein
VDGFEIDCFEDSPFDVLAYWYALLNCGFAVPLLGASGKDSNGIALGIMRTYARLLAEETFSYRSWIEAVRAGRTFVTNGPLLRFTINGHDPGTTLELDASTPTVRVAVEASSVVPFEHLEIIANGSVVASKQTSASPANAILEAELPVPVSGWIAARCRGAQQLFHRPANQRVFAHSSPVYVRVGGQPPRADSAALAALTVQLDHMLEWVERESRCETDKQRADFAHVFESAKDVLEDKARQ